MMVPDYEGGLAGDRVHGHPPPLPNDGGYQLDHERPNMTPSPSYSNGVYPPPIRPPASPSLSAHSDPRPSGERNRSQGRSGRTASGQLRICAHCGESLTGQFVRALEGTYHLDCFKCRDCGQIVASKFFPADDPETGRQYPLCETDYFRRLGLLCYQCGGALRGSYITALERKYHVDHFTCSLCSTVFGAQDSYYEHDGNVYCHYHYSTQFAQRCNGCKTAILKQFVEIFRNGQNQHWHPECYMIHKFWNVRLTPPQESSEPRPEPVDAESRDLIRQEEEDMENKVYRIWSVLSTFEESSAACISDMLLHVSNGAYMDGVFVAKKFIIYVDILFRSADRLDQTTKKLEIVELSYAREAKLLCKKIVAFFSLLSKTQEIGTRKLGVTQELLSLVTGLAHYLKLLIRICLQGTLRVEKEQHTPEALFQFLEDLSVLESVKNDDDESVQVTLGMSKLSANDSDQCSLCRKPIEDECALSGDKRWHLFCVKCVRCGKDLGKTLDQARLHRDQNIYCTSCEDQVEAWGQPLEHITKLQQYVFLLKVALARLLEILRSNGALPRTSEDPDLNDYDSADGSRLSVEGGPMMLRSDSRSKSYGGERERHQRESSYENTLNDVRRLRSTRLDKHLSSSLRKARTSRIMDGPEGRSVRPGSAGAETNSQNKMLQIEEDREQGGGGTTEQYFGHQDALTLDDIPRIVAAEQAREQQPNSYRASRQELFRSATTEAAYGPSNERSLSVGRDIDPKISGDPSPQRDGRKFFSELSGLEYFIVRHVAVLTMQPMLEPEFTLEELLGLIEARKATFWNKFGKAFGKNETRKGGKKKGTFGVPLEVIVERDGADSTDGVGPGALRIPAIIEDTITALKNKDLSVEGVFRKNGNIKKLTEQVAAVDREGCDVIRWNDETPHQLAALLKRYLRELPEPLMTQKLYRVWIAATKIRDFDKRRHCLHLTCCLLPQIHRDTLEVLFSFLKWVATFHQVDEDTGSRMDVHNLARVIAPNVLYSSEKSPSFSDEPMTAVACVEELIQYNEEMCMVPAELMDILSDSTLFMNNGEITTKEILKRIEARTVNGIPRQFDNTEFVGRQESRRPLATRVATDPAAWQQESSVRPVQEPTIPFTTPQGTPPPNWRKPDNGHSPYGSQSQFERVDNQQKQPDNGQRREWRNSGWGKPNSSVTTGTG
ncbi:RhoGAP-domain-containing protein [Hypoxylon sp. NC1633]|nr:RhoGAP-domain-containing protein [Hypoxylon sp. NC1633]